ncbi:hypothetical protein T12_6707 [Trichinella patagoniensis]|uniref:Uncharacterized protein n=2 Tax=Trichinella TaxID=6333 RepID=A0A0V0X1B7_9BILA|nr:hypothetical protein T12_6707 [Trichinella patagoniensis]KRY03543.1 hypothetical protein T01_5918 [Trichinella spiralis]
MGNTTITWKKSISKLVDTVPRQPTNPIVCMFIHNPYLSL